MDFIFVPDFAKSPLVRNIGGMKIPHRNKRVSAKSRVAQMHYRLPRLVFQPLARSIPLAEWARLKGIHYITAWKWFKHGKMPVRAEQTPSGMILVEAEQTTAPSPTEVWIYARVNSAEDRPELAFQIGAARTFAAAKGWSVAGIVQDQNPSESLNRKKLCALIARNPKRILVWDPSRIARLNGDFIEQIVAAAGIELIYLNAEPISSGLMQDLVAIIRELLKRRWGVKKRALLLEHLTQTLEPDFTV